MIVDGLALRAEDPAVGLEQVAALHARGAGPGADEQGHVGAVEGGLEVIGDVRARQQGKGAIVQLHGGAFGRLQGWGDLQEPQAHRNIRAEELPGGNAEEQGVADLARRAGYGDVYGSGHDGRLDRCGWVRCIEPGHPGTFRSDANHIGARRGCYRIRTGSVWGVHRRGPDLVLANCDYLGTYRLLAGSG